MEPMHSHDRDDARRIGLGAALIALGLLFLLANLGVIGALSWQLLWPAGLLAYGLVRIVVPRRAGGEVGAMWLATLGALWLMDRMALVTWSQSWPLFVILGGLTFVFRALGWVAEARPCRRVRP
jgi:hypothetical protein